MASSELFGKDLNSTQDELRIKKLFQACDTNRDGYIDSQDLLAICRELNLEHSLDELMEQLGADSSGRISYEQFLKRRIDLRPEIDALKCPTDTETTTTDCVSQGRLDSWEWDSGARDLSPVPNNNVKKIHVNNQESDCDESVNQFVVQKMMEEQAQRYEEQITELHSVIAELTRKLQQQRVMAIVEEDENSEVGDTSVAEQTTSEFVDEMSELEQEQNCDLVSNQSETSQDSNKEQSADESLMQILPETLKSSQEANIVEVNAEKSNQQNTWPTNSNNHPCTNAYRTVRSNQEGLASAPIVTKMAERVRLKRAVEQQTTGTATATSDQNKLQTQSFEEFEVVKLGAQLDHARAQNALLALTLDDTKEQCNRLSLLCGKYESNALALSVALGLTDSAIEAYDVLLALLETELSLDESRPASVENRRHVELAAHQLLSRLDQSNNVQANSVKWTPRHEARLREHVSRLKQERASVRNTCVEFESMHLDGTNATCASCKMNQKSLERLGQTCGPNNQHEMRKMDLETAVLLQEMMSLREQKAELVSRLVQCERERDNAVDRLHQINVNVNGGKR